MIDVYDSAVQPQGRFGAFFERDDDTAYFYLLDLDRPQGNQIIGALSAPSVVSMPADVGIRVAWTPQGDLVGLMVDGQLIAVFDLAEAEAQRYEGRPAQPGERSRFLDA